MEECKTEDCAENVYKDGLCEKHYQELTVEADITPENGETLMQMYRHP